MPLTDETISRYRSFYEDLTIDKVEGFRNLAAPDVRFRDPATDSVGYDAVIAYIRSWYENLDQVRFIMKEYAVNDMVGFQQWTMTFRIRKFPRKAWSIEGVSKVTFNSDGLVIDHFDFWDAVPLFEGFPILGKAITLIRKLSA